MDKNIPSELVFNLPQIKFTGKSGVKKLNVVVHAKVDDSSQLYDYLNKMVLEQMNEEDKYKR